MRPAPTPRSGHFLLAAARRLGRELAKVRAGEEQPAPSEFRRAVRDVIARCIYAVDLNPLAVDLCKVALWLESLEPGKPLSFLDSKVRWGNSLVGATRALVARGIPDEAYKPVSGDDKAAAGAFRKRNKKEREAKQTGQMSLALDFGAPAGSAAPSAAARTLNTLPDDSVAAVRAKADRYAELRAGAYGDMVRFNLWTAAFFSPLADAGDLAVPTTAALDEWAERPLLHNLMVKRAFELAGQVGFFHWELEFPEVFPAGEEGGFDVVLGNPPWERIKLQEQEHFVDVPAIRDAANKAAREKAIAAWRSGDERQRARIALFDAAKYRAEAESRFVRASARFPLTAVGDVNTYALFSEHSRNLLAPTGRAGIIVPTGIATDDTTKAFFADLNRKRQLVELYDFENRENIFQGVGHGRFKFCLITLGFSNRPTEFIFFATNINHLSEPQRRFTLEPEDIVLINPNTRTAPIFRTQADAKLTKKIYQGVPVLIDEKGTSNPWEIRYLAMIHMASDSQGFRTNFSEGLTPLYEAKMFWHFSHRHGDYADYPEGAETTALPPTPLERLKDPSYSTLPRYWVQQKQVDKLLAERNWDHGWVIAFRDIARSPDERTAIFSVLPRVGVGHTAPVIFPKGAKCVSQVACLLALLNGITFDFVVRQKLGGTHLTYTVLNQLPVLPPSSFSNADIAFIVPRVVELVYTAWDIRAFAEDVWTEGDEALRAELLRRNAACNAGADPTLFSPRDGFALPPYRWDEGRRAVARAELDARIARLYGLTRDELRYILDPADVYGPEFPGETFRVLKEKETRLYGEYRTRRLVLEAWDREEQGDKG